MEGKCICSCTNHFSPSIHGKGVLIHAECCALSTFKRGGKLPFTRRGGYERSYAYMQDGVGGLMILQETIDDGERNVCSRERERGRE